MDPDILAEHLVEQRLARMGFITLNLNRTARNHPGSDLLILTQDGERLIQVKSCSTVNEVNFGRGSAGRLRNPQANPFYGNGPFRPHFVACVFPTTNDPHVEHSSLIFHVDVAASLIVRSAQAYYLPFPGLLDNPNPENDWKIPLPPHPQGPPTRRARLYPFAIELLECARPIRGTPADCGLPNPWDGRAD